MQINCPNCNSNIDSDIVVCHRCGHQLNEPAQSITPRAIDLSPTEPEVVPPPLPPIPTAPTEMEASAGTILPPPIPTDDEPSKPTATRQSEPPRILSSNPSPEHEQVIKVLPRHMVNDITADWEVSLYHVLAFVGVFFGIGGIAMLCKGNFSTCILFFIGCGVSLYYSYIKDLMQDGDEVYVPKESFSLFRHNETYLKIAFVFIAITAILIIILFWNSNIGGRKYHHIYILAVLVIGVYQAYKALSVHGDVDFEANEALMDALNVDLDECVSVSTQTFDETEEQLKDGDKIIVVTNRKIYYALWYDGKWTKGIENLKSINSIGLKSTSLKGRTIMQITFDDGSNIMMHLDVANKMTTTPMLFVKKFLETLDDHLLGRAPEKKSRRRRVTTTGQEQSSSGQPTAAQSIIKGIAEAEQVSARKLDL